MPEEGLEVNEVVDELRAEPGIHADHISVTSSDGVIVLSAPRRPIGTKCSPSKRPSVLPVCVR